jgi:hypothetical protein
VLDRRRVQFVGQGLEHGFTGRAVVGENAHLDQAVGLERGIGFLLDGWCEPVAADHDDRVQMVRFGAVHLALRRGKLNGGHPRIIERQ